MTPTLFKNKSPNIRLTNKSTYMVFGTQEEDYTIHSVLTRTENLNKSVFSSFLIPRVNKNTIEEHICHVIAEGT